LTRYAPSFSVLIAGNEAWEDTFKTTARTAITNQVGEFELHVDDRFDRWSGGAGGVYNIQWNDAVIIVLDGTRVFKGRVDKPIRHVDKSQDAFSVKLTGRDDNGALQDIVASLHFVNADVNNIISEIINTYNVLKYPADPTIGIRSILPAPGTLNMSFQWKRKSLWSMLGEVADQLGAPVALGGLNTFYDFYVDPFDNFFFEPVGTRSTGIDLGGIGNPEIKIRDYNIDSLPVKNDIFAWGQNSAGMIPLQMQPGWQPTRADPWTEQNASDYQSGPTGGGIGSITISDDNTAGNFVMGSWSIKILGVIATNPAGQIRFYWIMPFPFGGPYPPGGSKWPAQNPWGYLNVYNEVSLAETMGEISGIGYFLRTDTPFDHLIEVRDVNDTLCQSEQVHIDPGGPFSNWLNPVWVPVSFPFGPSAGYKIVTSGVDAFDWSGVKEIRFVTYINGVGTLNIFFDGFRFFKPLIANKALSPPSPNTRRSQIVQATHLSDYKLLALYAQSILENMQNPQQYYELKNVGRNDLQAGYTVTSEGKSLVIRELDYNFEKGPGWEIDLKAWEET
jgi:hypothetical protein